MFGKDKALGPDLLGRLNHISKPVSIFEGHSNRYFVTKLFNILFVRALVAHLPAPVPVTITTVNPGFCRSSLSREFDNIFHSLLSVCLARTTEVGSRTLVHAGVGMDIQGKTAEYLSVCKVEEASDFVVGETGRHLGEQLWEETIAVLAKADLKVRQVVEKYLS